MAKRIFIATFAHAKQNTVGAIAQLVEQRTENPCVPGSIPGGTTSKKELLITSNSFFILGPFVLLAEQRTDSIYKLVLCVHGLIPDGNFRI